MRLPKILEESLKSIFKNKKNVFIALGFDIVLMLIYVFVTLRYTGKMTQFGEHIFSVALSAKGVKATASPTFTSIFVNPFTTGSILLIMLLMMLYAISLYFIFSYLFGVSTYICFNINKIDKKDMMRFVKRIFIINIPWAVVLFIYSLLSMYVAFVNTVRERMNMGTWWGNYVMLGLIILIMYLILVSYIKEGFRKGLNAGKKRFFPYFGYFMILLTGLHLITWIPLVLKFSYILILVYYPVIVLSYIIFLRIVFKKLNI